MRMEGAALEYVRLIDAPRTLGARVRVALVHAEWAMRARHALLCAPTSAAARLMAAGIPLDVSLSASGRACVRGSGADRIRARKTCIFHSSSGEIALSV